MTNAQWVAALRLTQRYNVPFDETAFTPAFDLPQGWVAGWAGPIYVGISPEGHVHS